MQTRITKQDQTQNVPCVIRFKQTHFVGNVPALSEYPRNVASGLLHNQVVLVRKLLRLHDSSRRSIYGIGLLTVCTPGDMQEDLTKRYPTVMFLANAQLSVTYADTKQRQLHAKYSYRHSTYVSMDTNIILNSTTPVTISVDWMINRRNHNVALVIRFKPTHFYANFPSLS